MNRRLISSMAGVPSMTSSSEIPATGEPRMTRGLSPQASMVVIPAPSSLPQIAGMSSTRIQWYWMFSRSVMSATSRPYSVASSPIVRSCSLLRRPPSMRMRSMKYSSSSSSGSRVAVRPPSIPGLRWV
jgi:hypothetical protein